MVVATLVFLGLPLVAAAALTATFVGWTSVAVAIIFWIALVVTAVIVARFAFRNFRPVRELVTSAGRLADGDYTARVSRTDSPAIRPVVESFNQMAERLEVSDDLRRRLLADVGHELRTPLTIIRGELEAMADGVRDLNPEELGRLLDDVAAMERLLDDLRTLSTTEAGMANLDREHSDVGDLIAEVVDRFSGQAAEQCVDVRSDVDAGTTAFADPDRVIQVLSNLAVNALRATSAGDELVLSARSGTHEGRAVAIVEVSDTGTGIDPDRLAAVFDRFEKSPDSAGSGLGLTISRDLVLAHSGTIDIDSQPTVGTTVTIRLPVQP